MKLVLKILALPVLFVVKVICILGNLSYKCCVLCNWFIALGHWRICDLLHCKGFVAVPAYSCGSWNCDNSSGVLARLGCYESREYWRKSGSIYQVIR